MTAFKNTFRGIMTHDFNLKTISNVPSVYDYPMSPNPPPLMLLMTHR